MPLYKVITRGGHEDMLVGGGGGRVVYVRINSESYVNFNE